MPFDYKAFKEEYEETNRVYYRLFVDKKDQPVVVCMQWFDEADYDQSRFINKEEYETEQKAEDALLALKLKANTPLTNLERFRVIRLLEGK